MASSTARRQVFGLPQEGAFLLRLWSPQAAGPVLARLRDGVVEDVTCREIPTVQALLELDDPAGWLKSASGRPLCDQDELTSNAVEVPSADRPHPLAPFDLQAVKACGVTFVRSMLERVIEEQAKGDSSRAEAIRQRCERILGDSLSTVAPGSEAAAELKAALIAEDAWSQYLEVGIGPDAEVFTKAQPMSSVGVGAAIGLHPASSWNNPEPEIVLAVDSKGGVKGATLGNDVNLRDVEGRSALLLGKAKDNNASCAIGPALRLFDDGFGLDQVRSAVIGLRVEGADGFVLEGRSAMAEISRDPLDLVAQTIGRHHQYPDGLCLFLGTMFAPVEDRGAPGRGFTHKMGDRVEISADGLGALVNTVRSAVDCPPWTFGVSALMRNLASRGLL